jgi:hypothetical protein
MSTNWQKTTHYRITWKSFLCFCWCCRPKYAQTDWRDKTNTGISELFVLDEMRRIPSRYGTMQFTQFIKRHWSLSSSKPISHLTFYLPQTKCNIILSFIIYFLSILFKIGLLFILLCLMCSLIHHHISESTVFTSFKVNLYIHFTIRHKVVRCGHT